MNIRRLSPSLSHRGNDAVNEALGCCIDGDRFQTRLSVPLPRTGISSDLLTGVGRLKHVEGANTLLPGSEGRAGPASEKCHPVNSQPTEMAITIRQLEDPPQIRQCSAAREYQRAILIVLRRVRRVRRVRRSTRDAEGLFGRRIKKNR